MPTDTLSHQTGVLLVEPQARPEPSLKAQFGAFDGVIDAFHTAEDIASARTVLSEAQIDCVVCLHDPPVIDGVEVLSTLRRAYPDIPVLLATETDRADDAIEAGATDLVRLTDGKFHQGIVANRIDSVVAQARERDKYEQLFERATDGIAVHDPDSGDVIEVNRRLYDLVDYQPDFTDGFSLADLVPDTDEYSERDIRELIGRTTDEPRTVEWRDRTDDGETICLEVSFERATLGGVDRVLARVRDITQREKRKRVLADLLETSRQFLRTSDPEDIAALVVESAEEILDHDIAVVRRYDPEAKTLVPIEASTEITDRIDDIPTYDVESDPVGEAFRSGDPVIASDLSSDDEHEYIESAMVLPMGQHGTFGVGATEPDAFDDEDRALAELLVTTATAAVDRIDQEAKLRQYRDIIQHVEGMMFLLDDGGRFQLVTDPFVAHLGYEREEVEGSALTDFLTDDTSGECATAGEPVAETLESGQRSFETTAVTADRKEVPLEIELSSLPDDTEKTGIVGIARDISEHKESERELRKTEQRLELALAATDTGVWEWNIETGALVTDETLERVFGVERGVFEETFDAFYERILPEDRLQVENAIDSTLESGGAYQEEFRMRHQDGSILWVAVRGRLVTDEDGTRRMIGVAQDITERKRREERLEALNLASTRLWEAKDKQTIAETTIEIAEEVLSEPLVAMWSYDESANELVPLAAGDDAAALDNSQAAADEIGPIPAGTTEMRVFREGETTVLEDYQQADDPAHPENPIGTLLIVPLGNHGQLHVGMRTVEQFDESTRKLIDVLARDTEAALSRVVRERELERSNERLMRTEQLADIGGWELDVATGTNRWTDGVRDIYEVSEEFDPDVESGIEFYHPDDREMIREAVKRCRETSEPYEIEAQLVTAHGHERWVETTGKAIKENGEVVRIVGAIRDITAQKQREQQLSVLYRILRHNLRNDLTVVKGFCAPLRREINEIEPPAALAGRETEVIDRLLETSTETVEESDLPIEELKDVMEAISQTQFDELQEYADRLEESAERLMSLGEKAYRLEGLITEQSGTRTRSQLEPVIETALESVRRDYPDASIDCTGIESVTIDGSEKQLWVLFEELIENAVEHRDGEDSPVKIRTELQENMLVFEVADRGPGIPEHEREVIQQGDENALLHGSGIGLWIANWIATHLGGSLTIEDNEPSGTVARVLLPQAGWNDVELASMEK